MVNKAACYNDSKQYDVVVENLVKKYKGITAVDNVSFKIQKGQFFSLLGPSGCGKTTTLRALAGFIEPDEGSIFIDGLLMNHVPPNRRPTNMVFQRLALFPHLTVADNITFGLRIKKVDKVEAKKRMEQALELVRLTGYEDRRIHELSGGQQQRVAIARALVNRPKVLLLDEPLGSLDLQLRLQMQIELKRLQASVGTTFIYVTHDQDEAMTMSDQVAIMNAGKIMQISSPQEIYEQPSNSFVAKFIGDTNLIEGKVVEVNGNLVKVKAKEGIQIWGETTGNKYISVGQVVNLSIRLEDVLVNEGTSSIENRFEGYIEEITYHGSNTQYQININKNNSNLKIRSRVINTNYKSSFTEGEKVNIGWTAKCTIVLTQNEESD